MDSIKKNRKHRQTKLVLPFLEKFIEHSRTDIKLSESIIATTFNNIKGDIYVRLEEHDRNRVDTKLYIDVVNRKDDFIKCNEYYHVPWLAITHYLRDCDYNILEKPLREYMIRKQNFVILCLRI